MKPVFTYHLRSVLPGEYHVAAGLGRLVAMKISFGSTIEVRHSEDGGKTWTGNYLPSPYSYRWPFVLFNGVEFGLSVEHASTFRRVLLTGNGESWSSKAESNDETGLFPGGGYEVVRAAPNHWIFNETAFGESGISYKLYAKPSSNINYTAASFVEESYDLSGTIVANNSTAMFLTNDGVPAMFNRLQSILLRGGTFERHDIPNLYGPSTAGIIRTPEKIVTFDGAHSTDGVNWALSPMPRLTPSNFSNVHVQQADTNEWTGLPSVAYMGKWYPIATKNGVDWVADDPSFELSQVAPEVLVSMDTGAQNVYPVPTSGANPNVWTLTDDGKIYLIHQVMGETYIVEAVPFVEPTFWTNLRACDEVQ